MIAEKIPGLKTLSSEEKVGADFREEVFVERHPLFVAGVPVFPVILDCTPTQAPATRGSHRPNQKGKSSRNHG